MFAASPLVIANAPYEATMGLVQKIYYYHMPAAWVFLTSAVVCGVASARFLASGEGRHDRLAMAAAEMTVPMVATTSFLVGLTEKREGYMPFYRFVGQPGGRCGTAGLTRTCPHRSPYASGPRRSLLVRRLSTGTRRSRSL